MGFLFFRSPGRWAKPRSVRVPGAPDDQGIHAQTMKTFSLGVHPSEYQHPCPHPHNVRVPSVKLNGLRGRPCPKHNNLMPYYADFLESPESPGYKILRVMQEV